MKGTEKNHKPYRLSEKTLNNIAKNVGITKKELKDWSLCKILNHIKKKKNEEI